MGEINTKEKEIQKNSENISTAKSENNINQENNPKNEEENKEQNKKESTHESKKENKTEENSNSTTSKICSIISKIILILIIISCAIISVRALVYHKYDIFGHRFYLIMSGSMEPTIMTGDAVITKETDNLKEGDIIAFSENGSVTVHRIIKVYTEDGKEPMYQTKGDNNNVEDGIINKNAVKGKVFAKIPKAGTTILFIKNHVIIFIWITIILIFAILARRLI